MSAGLSSASTKLEADRRREEIFMTTARDLIDGDPIVRRALANVVHNDNELRYTTGIMSQWMVFMSGSVEAAAKVIATPVLIVIDDSRDAYTSEQILRVLAARRGLSK